MYGDESSSHRLDRRRRPRRLGLRRSGAPRFIRADTGDPRPGTLSVTGTGVVKTQPDTATTSFGVTTQAGTAQEATAQNAEAMAKVIDALKRAGVDPKDLQTQLVSLDPRYDSQGREI